MPLRFLTLPRSPDVATYKDGGVVGDNLVRVYDVNEWLLRGQLTDTAHVEAVHRVPP